MYFAFTIGSRQSSWSGSQLLKDDMDKIAQSSCVGLNDKEGWVYAVPRYCGGNRTCDSICKSRNLKAQDSHLSGRTYVFQPFNRYFIDLKNIKSQI